MAITTENEDMVVSPQSSILVFTVSMVLSCIGNLFPVMHDNHHGFVKNPSAALLFDVKRFNVFSVRLRPFPARNALHTGLFTKPPTVFSIELLHFFYQNFDF